MPNISNGGAKVEKSDTKNTQKQKTGFSHNQLFGTHISCLVLTFYKPTRDQTVMNGLQQGREKTQTQELNSYFDTHNYQHSDDFYDDDSMMLMRRKYLE